MKTILIAIVTLFLSVNIYAVEPVIYTNEKTTDFGKQIEQTIFVEGSTPNKRQLSNYNHAGVLTQQITYKWKSFDGWIPVSKRTYNYNGANELTTITFVKWDRKANSWNKKSEVAHYNTIASNSLFLVEKIK